jgi:hypothetical protein
LSKITAPAPAPTIFLVCFRKNQTFSWFYKIFMLFKDIPVINCQKVFLGSVAEPHDFHAATAPGENFDAVPTPAPTLLYM